MIVITGAAGFIGSCLAQKMIEAGNESLILVDDFSIEKKKPNFENKKCHARINRMEFLNAWFPQNAEKVTGIFHLGARTDTTEKEWDIFELLNLNYSKEIWEICVKHQIPMIYASSAATYGGGENGYEDNHQIVEQLKPLNPYGKSKNDFDIWALTQTETPPKWAGLKFFNVYGPNEYHKGRMASVIFHTYNQIQATGAMKLFRSHREDYANGEQQRDFIYVKDVVNVCQFLLENNFENGLYNLGTGTARSFLDLATQTFLSAGVNPAISFIDTPIDIRDTYQYFTEANMSKLKQQGYSTPFHSLEEGVADYVKNYLVAGKIW